MTKVRINQLGPVLVFEGRGADRTSREGISSLSESFHDGPSRAADVGENMTMVVCLDGRGAIDELYMKAAGR